MEGRDVATADIPGAYLNADQDDEVIIKIEGVLVEILLNIDR